uniref:Uncharacterized protein n=1 Tax=Ursus maritimus TaxID=29073 RepID=A0A452SYX9_URSMA
MGVGGTHLNFSVTSLVPVPSSQTMVADTHPLPSPMQVAETLPIPQERTRSLSPFDQGGPTDSLDWLEALSGGPLLGCGPPAPSIFSADLSDSSGTRLLSCLTCI